jgi:hypothetical protein
MIERGVNKMKKYGYYGIRTLSEDEQYEKGDICRNSYEWDFENDCSTYDNDERIELDGTSCTEIWDGNVKRTLEQHKYGDGTKVLIAGNRAQPGYDANEIVISNAIVLRIMK